MALHEDESSVAAGLLVMLLSDHPAALGLVVNLAVLSRDSLQLDFDVSFHRSTHAERSIVLVVVVNQDLILNHVLVLIN